MALSLDKFQGVLCHCLGCESTVHETVAKLLDLSESSVHHNINCSDLELKNKYYTTRIHLFDYNSLSDENKSSDFYADCHAIVLYANGQTITLEQLDLELQKLSEVCGEPRILICDGIDEDCAGCSSLREWSVKNGFDFLLTSEEDVKQQLIDSLSAYRWPHSQATKQPSTSRGDERQLDGELMKKLMDFDSLLGKMRAFKEKPELRGDANDKKIEEIAEILTGLLGDDVDNFLECEDPVEPK